MSAPEVVVTGLGMVSPAGIGIPDNWDTLRSGVSVAGYDAELAGLPVDFSCAVPGFDADALLGRRTSWRLDRFSHLALVAAREAVADAGLTPRTADSDRVGVVLGVGASSPQHHGRDFAHLADGRYRAMSPLFLPRSIPNMAAGEIAIDQGFRGPNFTTGTACASGTTSIGVARDLVRSGTCDVVVTGGSDSLRSPIYSATFWRMDALARDVEPEEAARPFDARRNGFVLGEGAGIMVLERAEHARARGARVRARVAGYGASADAHHFTSPDPQGRGAKLAIRSALEDAGLVPGDVDHISAHATSTPTGDRSEARTLRDAFPGTPPVTALKSIIGHAQGAAGSLEAVTAVLTLEHQEVPPTANLDRIDPEIDLDVVVKAPLLTRVRTVLSTSFGFGGQNAALLLHSA
ncbi:3-oxoacyl-[acyl-carrier-protein] synthase II [Lipingzhangella halophila]|uniref:3-oxoacyl-[acyl-carrier-protein] synthase II n=1 Tax=Lipingzhangella halophila TaxID=1783352 RepID=A0A7W7RHB9_9ACTN|nr:beta-ketoacyl-[acyl-carrier-protein] synthase family protein [Lipingzhangella halophila]MBB4931895.1 3-oxoacyl-[acyl-carrier-protein] synthase II [Lipingzhangella halophila]